jgi:hypothetical protein
MEKKFPHQRLHYASCQRQKDIRNLSDMLVSMSTHPTQLASRLTHRETSRYLVVILK